MKSYGVVDDGESAHGKHWIGGLVDPRAGLDEIVNLKFLTLPRLELVQLVASRYTDPLSCRELPNVPAHMSYIIKGRVYRRH
jgi:hypothetical protein